MEIIQIQFPRPHPVLLSLDKERPGPQLCFRQREVGMVQCFACSLLALGHSLGSADKAELIRQDAFPLLKSLLTTTEWPFFPEVNAFEMIPDKALELKT